MQKSLLVLASLTLAATVALPLRAAKLGEEMKEGVDDTIALFKKIDPTMAKFFDEASGYAVFPKVTKGAVGIGAAKGTGVLIEKGGPSGEVKLTQITLGAQLGGQVYSEVVFFEDDKSIEAFKQGDVEFSAQVSAVAAAEGASKNAKYELGVAIFTVAQGGLMFEASVGGQKFKYSAYKDKD